MEFIKSSHSVYYTEYHIVWVTKYRKNTLNPGFAAYIKKVISDVASRIEAVEIKEINHRENHLHLMMIIPPKYQVCKIVEIIKSRSAKIIRKKFQWLDKPYYGTTSFWSPGYCVSTVGLNEEMIRKYIQHQQKQDFGQLKIEL